LSVVSGGDRIRVICGPTAAGKSALALRLATEFGGRIISADSRQIYRGFDVGTAKPSREEQRAVRHYGIDLIDADIRFSAAAWASHADAAIAETIAAGEIPMIVGGTGFYIRALFAPLFREPQFDENRRMDLQAELEALSIDVLRRWCFRLDPARAHLGRTQLIRAIEVALLSGERLSTLHEREVRHARWSARYLLVDPGPVLSAAIESRVYRMMDDGWKEEVERLSRSVPESAPAWKATGYRSILALQRGTIGTSDAVEDVIVATRQYAKRQRTWFRNQLAGEMVTVVDSRSEDAYDRAVAWWNNDLEGSVTE
jgi:tRNA dimethylallyltransferase